MLCGFVQKLYPEAESEAVLFLRLACLPGMFQKLEKLVKLKSEVGNLESELETNLKTAVQQHSLISTSSTSSPHGALATNEGEGAHQGVVLQLTVEALKSVRLLQKLLALRLPRE